MEQLPKVKYIVDNNIPLKIEVRFDGLGRQFQHATTRDEIYIYIHLMKIKA